MMITEKEKIIRAKNLKEERLTREKGDTFKAILKEFLLRCEGQGLEGQQRLSINLASLCDIEVVVIGAVGEVYGKHYMSSLILRWSEVTNIVDEVNFENDGDCKMMICVKYKQGLAFVVQKK